MQEFLILFRGPDGRSLRDKGDAFEAHFSRLQSWIAALPAPGEIVMAEPLSPGGRLLRMDGGIVTDGPFIEGKEMVGGFLRFRVASLESALAWARACPIFEVEGGMVELRAIETP